MTFAPTGRIVHKADMDFLDAYADEFPLGNLIEWHLHSELIKWIESIIYYSFLRHSIPGIFVHILSNITSKFTFI